jgi:hypothetical protein
MKLLNWKAGYPGSVSGLVSKIKAAAVPIAAPAPVQTKPTEFEKFLSIRTEFLLVMKSSGHISEAEFNAHTAYIPQGASKSRCVSDNGPSPQASLRGRAC